MPNSNMMISLFSNMMKNMSEEELKKTLERSKSMLSPDDYAKLEELIKNKPK